jgi:Domain of unknown function (DUF4399)
MVGKLHWLFPGLVVIALSLVACDGGETDAIITRPEQGSTVEAGNVTVSVDVKKFDVVDKLGQAPEDGDGHVHFYIDVGEIPTVAGEPATTDEGTYHAQATTEFTWEDVEPGEHTFAVQLVNNDHTPLNPPVIAQVTVEVEAADGGGASPTRSPARSPTPTEEETATPTEEPTQAASPTRAPTASPAATSPSSPTGTP